MSDTGPNETDLGELVNETLAADLLCQSVRTLQKWRTLGSGPAFFKSGRSVRYSRRDLKNWLTQNRRKHTSEPLQT
jgi:hypothetical protein